LCYERKIFTEQGDGGFAWEETRLRKKVKISIFLKSFILPAKKLQSAPKHYVDVNCLIFSISIVPSKE
jgi:hypothetical protein